MKTLKVLTTGGTIDKVYFDAQSEFQVGPPQVESLLQAAGVNMAYTVDSLLYKDSLELTDNDRKDICDSVRQAKEQHILITHGTDTMVKTAQALIDSYTIDSRSMECAEPSSPSTEIKNAWGKTIVLTGAMQPACCKESDAAFNIGYAVAAIYLLPPGVYMTMNGSVFTPDNMVKNRARQRFEKIR